MDKKIKADFNPQEPVQHGSESALLHKLDASKYFSILAGLIVALSLSHHWLDFWELPLVNQIGLLLLLWPVSFVCIWFLARRLWQVGEKITRRRWLFFLLPALVLTLGLAVYLLSPPMVWHQLEIIPSSRSVQLLEIKLPGRNVRFSELGQPLGWQLRNRMMVANSQGAQPIRYSFLAPVDKPIVFTFLASPEGSDVTLVVDNEKMNARFADPITSQKRLSLNTGYRFGVSGAFINLVIILIDLLALMLLFTVFWLAQEITVIRQNADLQVKHHKPLLVLLFLALVLHAVHFLAVPLISGPDTHGYLDGAAYWMQHHSLDGIPTLRGPGPTVLFLPIMLLFERNPLGMKLLLHLLAIGCVPLAYRLGWQLGRRPSLAFGAGLVAVLTPDLMFYSSYIMSDLPNIFFGLLFCTLLFSALETFSWKWLAAAMLSGSFAVLFRSENLAPLVVGVMFLLIKLIWEWKTQSVPALPRFRKLGLAALLAFAPIMAWVAHNYIQHEFLGLTDYEPAFYDGWVYYGERSHISITDEDSQAVDTLHAVTEMYSAEIPVKDQHIPTGMQTFGVLGRHGYTDRQALTLLRQATWDSIFNDLDVTLTVLEIKIRKGLLPETLLFQHTFPLPGDKVRVEPTTSEYFDADRISFEPAIYLQRWADDWLDKWYQYGYPVWVWFSLGMLLLCCYRRPFLLFMPFILITLARLFTSMIIALPFWRYVMAGIVPLQIFGLIGLWSLIDFFVFLYKGQTAQFDDSDRV